MKKITLLLLLFVSTAFYAQSTGISYQAIIYNPNGEVIPGYNNTNSPLANKNICLQFTIIDSASLTEYQEKITITTDEYGMVNTVIGTGIQTGGYATSFATVNWSLPSKRLKVGLDTFALCTNFIEISNQLFTSVPYAFAANSAENVTGVVQIRNGGTSATTVLGAKTNLGLENVDNTRDINKPISIATQAALNLKEDLVNKSTNVTTDGTSNTKYPTVKAVKDYVDAGVNAGGTALANEAVIRANADLLKEDLVNKSTNVVTDGASNTKYPSVKAIKTYVDAADANLTTNLNAETASRIAGDISLTTNLAAEIARATALDNTLTSNLSQELLRATAVENTLTTNLASEVTRATAAEATKENLTNKSINVTTDGASDIKYPSVKSVKTYVDASATSGTLALSNEATIRANADAALQTNITTLGSTVTANATTAAAATALKENSANKSTDVTLADATNTKFPTELAVKTFVNNQITTANATNANLTGVVTSTGNATAIANGAITNVMLANVAVANLSGTNTGDQTNITGNAATATTATNVSGVVAIANGGTGATTGAGALTNLGAAPTASPTFTGTVTAGPINAGALTANASISSEITADFTISNANSELYKGKVLICNPSSQITITFNSDLPTGFNCMVLQKSADANKINLVAGSGIVIKNRNNYTATSGNYAIATVVNIGGGIIVTAGDMQ